MALLSGKLSGISEELRKKINVDMDKASARRGAREAFKEVQLALDHCLFKLPNEGLKIEKKYEINSRGMEIFSKSWLPEWCSPKALLFYCHDYGETCTFFFEGVARRLAYDGYRVFAMDYPGFGLSEGLHGYIPSFNKLVHDVIEHFSNIKEEPEFLHIRSFLFGQSMGAVEPLKVHIEQRNAWSGAILITPCLRAWMLLKYPWTIMMLMEVDVQTSICQMIWTLLITKLAGRSSNLN